MPPSRRPGLGTKRSSPDRGTGGSTARPCRGASEVKTRTETAGGWLRPKPRAEPMKGAVQGVATTVASAPLQNEAARPVRRAVRLPAAMSEVPTSKTPKRFSPSRRKRPARKTTKAGDWSWKPQPTCSPAARSARSSPASAQKETSTPAVKAAPCRHGAPSLARVTDEAEHLQREHGQHARHEVQDEPAQEREAEREGQGATRRLPRHAPVAVAGALATGASTSTLPACPRPRPRGRPSAASDPSVRWDHG